MHHIREQGGEIPKWPLINYFMYCFWLNESFGSVMGLYSIEIVSISVPSTL